MAEVRARWSEFLRLAAGENPDLAGRLRQGSVGGIHGHAVQVVFDKLFEKHCEYLAQEEQRFLCEQLFERFYGTPCRLNFAVAGATPEHGGEEATTEQGQGPGEPPQDLGRYRADPRVQILQKIFKAKIRDVQKGTPAPGYHLGNSCNFNEETR